MPLFHVTGCNSQLLPTCETGGTTVLMPAFDVQSVPAIYWLALNQPNFRDPVFSSAARAIKWLMYGGAPIAPALVGRILEAFPEARVGNGFGLTETTSVATFLPHEYARTRPDSVGFAAPVVDLKLFEIDAHSGVGDLARIDAEGFVEIVDRKKDMINRGGENVYCVEVESALAAHPAVFEVAVVGVPDEMMGEKVGAVIVVRPGVQPDVNDILAFVRQRLADFKVPQYLAIRQEPLARNPGGKVLKARLRKSVDWGRPV